MAELLVTVSIMLVVIGITVPMVSAMRRDTGVGAAINTVSMAVDVARGWSARPEADLESIGIPGASWSGTAALFTPGGEIRIVSNDQWAQNQGGQWLEELGLNGYADIQSIDAVALPRTTRIAGITRRADGTATGELVLIPPPFAIAFNKQGNVSMPSDNPSATSPQREDLIYYDADYDVTYDTDDFRPDDYEPEQWNWRVAGGSSALAGTPPRYTLPFEAIDRVVGVIIFDQTDFADGQGLNWTDNTDSTLDQPEEIEAMRRIGRMVFFSPHSGVGRKLDLNPENQ